MAFEVFKVKKEIIWRFKNFGKISSNTFPCLISKDAILSYDQNVTKWHLKLYPNGMNTSDQGHLGLFLHLQSSTNDKFFAKVNFILRGFETIRSTFETEGHSFTNGRGYPKLISHQDLLELIGKCRGVTIVCELSIYEKAQPNEKLSISASATIQDDFKRMFEEELFCDLDIKTNDSVILKAHKNILAARSPVLLKMLTTDMKETTTNVVEIDDFDSVTIQEMLRYIYCEEIENFEKIANDLIYAAEKYEIARLKEVCIAQIASKVTRENVVEALTIADHISGAGKLVKACVPIVSMNYRDLFEDPKCKKLPQDILLRLMTETLDKYWTCRV